ncbi:MAG: threonylcarbamoyl-AMP synthase [Erysipelotrichales bacterium]|nr:threonylcarbamoyl-AMP synthase [Erysipelotrichales bacterium]
METRILEETQLEEVVELLLAGEVVAFPTDTVYGVACIYDNEEAIKKMKEAKGRPEYKPFPLMVSNKTQIQEVANTDERSEYIIDAWMPGAITIVLNKKSVLPDSATNNEPTVAIRMADDELVTTIINKVGKPLLVTSANLSGEPSTSRYKEVYEKLNGRIAALVARDSRGAKASTILDLTSPEIKVLREGPITLDRILMSLKNRK